MAIPHIVVFVTASLAVLALPCAVAIAVRTDRPPVRRARTRQARRHLRVRPAWTWQGRRHLRVRPAWTWQGRRHLRALRRLDRALRRPGRPAHRAVPGDGPSLEQVGAELRRLDAQRHGGPTGGSERWTAAVDRAYDQWLRIACRYLSVTAHLPAPGDDVDQDLERLRVEAKLAEAGLRIRPARRPPR